MCVCVCVERREKERECVCITRERRVCRYNITGIGIFDNSFPIQFFIILHRDNLTLGLGHIWVRLDVIVGVMLSIKPGVQEPNL